MNKEDRRIMDKLQGKVDKNHDTLLKLEPTINRLNEYFKQVQVNQMNYSA